MKSNIIIIVTIAALLIITSMNLYSQNLKVEYKKLTSPLLKGDSPIIAILEEDNALFDALSKYPDFTGKFTCYSSDVIAGLKDALQVEEFNPEDKKFQQALMEQLSVQFILNWKRIADTSGVFILDIYSTEDSHKVYSARLYPSVNSNQYEDVKKLIVDNMEPAYIAPAGDLEVTAVPETAHFKLLKGDEVIKEWTGSEVFIVDAGKYRLLAEAEKYFAEELDVEITAGHKTTVSINLKREYSSIISVRSIDEKISNIRTDINEDQVRITFDLETSKKADINLVMLDKQSGNTRILKMTAGDYTGVQPGKNKTIFWEVKKELGKLPDNAVEIQLTAKEAGGISWYYYAGGGAALLGGAAVLLLGGGGDDGGTDTPPAGKIGVPPDRP